jgi:L-amino acid N-acyltransferase YncA
MGNQITIRDAKEADVPAINEIYNWYILNSVATFDIEPQSLEEKLRWFRETKNPHCVFVADEGGEVVGFSCLRPFRPKAAYSLTAENSVYVDHEKLGRGIGKLLMDRLVVEGKANGFHSIIAGIALPNEASVRLHETAGFTPVGVEREVGYKFERWVDVLWMQLMLASG